MVSSRSKMRSENQTLSRSIIPMISVTNPWVKVVSRATTCASRLPAKTADSTTMPQHIRSRLQHRPVRQGPAAWHLTSRTNQSSICSRLAICRIVNQAKCLPHAGKARRRPDEAGAFRTARSPPLHGESKRPGGHFASLPTDRKGVAFVKSHGLEGIVAERSDNV